MHRSLYHHRLLQPFATKCIWICSNALCTCCRPQWIGHWVSFQLLSRRKVSHSWYMHLDIFAIIFGWSNPVGRFVKSCPSSVRDRDSIHHTRVTRLCKCKYARRNRHCGGRIPSRNPNVGKAREFKRPTRHGLTDKTNVVQRLLNLEQYRIPTTLSELA